MLQCLLPLLVKTSLAGTSYSNTFTCFVYLRIPFFFFCNQSATSSCIAAAHVIIFSVILLICCSKWPLAILLWPSFDPPPFCCYLWYHHLLSQGDHPAHTEQHAQLELARPKTEFIHFWMFVDLSRFSLCVWLLPFIPSYAESDQSSTMTFSWILWKVLC